MLYTGYKKMLLNIQILFGDLKVIYSIMSVKWCNCKYWKF